MQQTPNYALKKPELNDVPDITQLNPNWDTIDQKLKEAIDTANSPPPNSVNDDAIGERTPEQNQVPASPGTGKITQLVSWLANRIKAITGKANWWDAPVKSIQQLSDEQAAHLADTMPHRFTDGTTTYRWGLSVVNGVVMFNYEEVV